MGRFFCLEKKLSERLKRVRQLPRKRRLRFSMSTKDVSPNCGKKRLLKKSAQGEKDLQKVRDLLHTVEYRKKQHAEVLQAREDRLEAERIEVREKMKGDREWKEQLREKEQRRRATNKEFQQNHLERINERAAL